MIQHLSSDAVQCVLYIYLLLFSPDVCIGCGDWDRKILCPHPLFKGGLCCKCKVSVVRMASSWVGSKSAATDLSFGGPFDGNALLANKNFLH